jgi:hypothetical protein
MTWKIHQLEISITQSELRTSFVKNDGVEAIWSLEKSQKYAAAIEVAATMTTW